MLTEWILSEFNVLAAASDSEAVNVLNRYLHVGSAAFQPRTKNSLTIASVESRETNSVSTLDVTFNFGPWVSPIGFLQSEQGILTIPPDLSKTIDTWASQHHTLSNLMKEDQTGRCMMLVIGSPTAEKEVACAKFSPLSLTTEERRTKGGFSLTVKKDVVTDQDAPSSEPAGPRLDD